MRDTKEAGDDEGGKTGRFRVLLSFSFSLSVQLFPLLFPEMKSYVHPRHARRKHRAERRHGENRRERLTGFGFFDGEGLKGEEGEGARRSGIQASVSTREFSLSTRAKLVGDVAGISTVARAQRMGRWSSEL